LNWIGRKRESKVPICLSAEGWRDPFAVTCE